MQCFVFGILFVDVLQFEKSNPKFVFPICPYISDLIPFRVVLSQAYHCLTGGFLLLRNFSVGISVSPHVCFILDLILISMFLR